MQAVSVSGDVRLSTGSRRGPCTVAGVYVEIRTENGGVFTLDS